jgi:hypothetical protein
MPCDNRQARQNALRFRQIDIPSPVMTSSSPCTDGQASYPKL